MYTGTGTEKFTANSSGTPESTAKISDFNSKASNHEKSSIQIKLGTSRIDDFSWLDALLLKSEFLQ